MDSFLVGKFLGLVELGLGYSDLAWFAPVSFLFRGGGGRQNTKQGNYIVSMPKNV